MVTAQKCSALGVQLTMVMSPGSGVQQVDVQSHQLTMVSVLYSIVVTLAMSRVCSW